MVGFDGKTYFCLHCGKAGFEKPTSVRAHQASCKIKVRDYSSAFSGSNNSKKEEEEGEEGGGRVISAFGEEIRELRRRVEEIERKVNSELEHKIVRGGDWRGFIVVLVGALMMKGSKKGEAMYWIGLALIGLGAYLLVGVRMNEVIGDAVVKKLTNLI